MDDEINEEQFYDKLHELTHYDNLKFTHISEDEIVKRYKAYKEIRHDYDYSSFYFVEYTDGKVGMKSKKFSRDNYVNLMADNFEELLQKYADQKSSQEKPKKRKEKEIDFYVYHYRKNPNEHLSVLNLEKRL